MTTQLAKLQRLNLLPGQTFDLRKDRNGRSWNFLLEADRTEAKRLIQEEKPYIVIGSLPCTSFCSFNRRLNYRNMDPEQVRRAIHEGNVLLKFALEIYELQLHLRRVFPLDEHLCDTGRCVTEFGRKRVLWHGDRQCRWTVLQDHSQ